MECFNSLNNEISLRLAARGWKGSKGWQDAAGASVHIAGYGQTAQAACMHQTKHGNHKTRRRHESTMPTSPFITSIHPGQFKHAQPNGIFMLLASLRSCPSGSPQEQPGETDRITLLGGKTLQTPAGIPVDAQNGQTMQAGFVIAGWKHDLQAGCMRHAQRRTHRTGEVHGSTRLRPSNHHVHLSVIFVAIRRGVLL